MARNKSPMFRIDAGTTTTAAELGNKFADPNKRKRKERIEIQPSKLNVDVHGILFANHLGDKTELNRAKAMGHSRAVPYLDWWALANSADIVVRRHAGCIPQASTFSTTARAWGLDVERASKRARPDFDGLV